MRIFLFLLFSLNAFSAETIRYRLYDESVKMYNNIEMVVELNDSNDIMNLRFETKNEELFSFNRSELTDHFIITRKGGKTTLSNMMDFLPTVASEYKDGFMDAPITPATLYSMSEITFDEDFHVNRPIDVANMEMQEMAFWGLPVRY